MTRTSPRTAAARTTRPRRPHHGPRPGSTGQQAHRRQDPPRPRQATGRGGTGDLEFTRHRPAAVRPLLPPQPVAQAGPDGGDRPQTSPEGSDQSDRLQRPRPSLVPPRRPTPSEDPVANAVRNRRQGERDPRSQHRRPRHAPQARRCDRHGWTPRSRHLGLRDRAPPPQIPRRPQERTRLRHPTATQRRPGRPRPVPRRRARKTFDSRAWSAFKQASGGWILHRVRHSSLTHLGEEGVSAILLQAESRHQDPRTLARYARPDIEALATLTAEFDRGRRHRQ